MIKKINESLPIKQRIGQIGVNNQGLKMTIIAYRGCDDIDVQFEDETIVENRRYGHFLKGTITNHNYKDSRIIDRTSETNINNQGLKMIIIAYRGANDIDVQFEDGTIVENKQYNHFLKGIISYPNYYKKNRIGETNVNGQGIKMTIIDYRNNNDIDVQFEDGTIVEHKQYDNFLKGSIAHFSYHNKNNKEKNKYFDGVSLPEKFTINILKQLNVDFLVQLTKTTFEWCNNYRYDFYIPSFNMIIETHGMQHFEKGFECCGGRSLEEEQENDKFKKELALNNNIDNYIIIDCRYSKFDWLKENIIKELSPYFNLSNIDWELVWENSLKNLILETKRLVEEGYSNVEIAAILGVNKHTIKVYKKQLGIKTQYENKQDNLLITKELLKKGKTVKKIAETLNVDISTIYKYKKELNL